jgi:hypothetical protein
LTCSYFSSFVIPIISLHLLYKKTTEKQVAELSD